MRSQTPTPRSSPSRPRPPGAAFAADGRSVNNVLGYPGIFRGALQSGAAGINVAMKLAAADVIAELAKDGSSSPTRSTSVSTKRSPTAVKDAAERSGIARPERATTDL